jgi:hypothetical protein
MMVKNAPYKFAEFESLTFKYGTGDSLVNQYHSKTAHYQYLNNKDSLVTRRVKLRKDDLLYIHRKAAQLGFWNFPSQIINTGESNSLKYVIELKYQRKTKAVLFSVDYNGDPKLKDAVRRLISEVNTVIADAEDKQAR